MKFFDRDNVSSRKLRRLEKMINRNAKFEDLDHGSRAIVPVCTWLIALVDYHYAKMAVQPYRDRLKEAERTLVDVSCSALIYIYMYGNLSSLFCNCDLLTT